MTFKSSTSIRKMEHLYLLYLDMPHKYRFILARSLEEISSHDPR